MRRLTSLAALLLSLVPPAALVEQVASFVPSPATTPPPTTCASRGSEWALALSGGGARRGSSRRARTCAAGNEVHLQLFPTQEHRPSLAAGAPKWLAWIDALFEKKAERQCKARKKTCTRGDIHPRVTGCDAKFQGFDSLEKLYKSLKEQGYEEEDWDEVIKPTAENRNPTKGTRAFYAVANGKSVGVLGCFPGKNGCKCQVDKVPGACHKHFKTKEQADAFIEDWKQSVASIYYNAIKKALDEGKRPRDMKFDISGLLPVQTVKVEAVDDVGLQLGSLRLA